MFFVFKIIKQHVSEFKNLQKCCKVLIISYLHAGVAKLVDVPDLGSGAVRHGGSSPSTRTFLDIGGLIFDN
jgi:hypothetical protein